MEDLVFMLDASGQVSGWNERAARITGHAAGEILGRHVSALYGAEEAASALSRRALDRAMAEGLCEEKVRVRLADGTVFSAMLAATAMRDGADNLTGFVVAMREAPGESGPDSEDGATAGSAPEDTARALAQREAEWKLRSERLFTDAMMESMPGIFYFYDKEGRFLRWNRNFESASGYAGAEIARMHPLDFFLPGDKTRLERRIAQVFESGESSVAAAFLAKDGTATPYFFTGRRVIFQGTPCLVGVGMDVSEQARAEAELAESEARYRKLFACAPDGIVIADPESVYLDANPSICRMLGYAREELVGLHASDIVDEEEIPQIGRALEAIRTESEHHREWRFRRKDGSYFPAEVMATRMPDGNLMGMIRDISERKRADAEKERRQRAEAADRIKSDFLATMSHELRTPLNSIIGFTGIMLQKLAGPLTEEQGKQLDMVRTSARHLLALVNDVLDISKIEAGQLDVAREPFEPRASIDKVLAIVAPQAEAKGLELHTSIPEDWGQAVGDQRRFEQILLNLLSNAIKFTERGRIGLKGELIREGGTPDLVSMRLEVTDTGMGIKPADLPALFHPFRQIDSGLARRHEGTGLGLAICRRLADLMGGRIAARSEWGKGSAFSVTLPMKGPHKR